MSAIRMLALDLDGTLAARGDEVTPATRKALHHANENGVEVVIATGRRYRTACRVVESLGLAIPVVCLGGALIKERDRTTLHAFPILPQDIAVIARLMYAHGLSPVGQRDSHAYGGADFVVDASMPLNQSITTYVDDNSQYSERCDSLADHPREDVLVAGTFGERDLLLRVEQELHRLHAERFYSNVVPSPGDTGSYLEIIRSDLSKWAGLQQLALDRGIPVDAICAVGDEVNDLPMIEGSGLGVAMGNGSQVVKAAADWVCGPNDKDGIVQVVEHILG